MKYTNILETYNLKIRNKYGDREAIGNEYIGGAVELVEDKKNKLYGLMLWSGLGSGYDYSFLVKIKSEQHLRDLLDNLGFERIE